MCWLQTHSTQGDHALNLCVESFESVECLSCLNWVRFACACSPLLGEHGSLVPEPTRAFPPSNVVNCRGNRCKNRTDPDMYCTVRSVRPLGLHTTRAPSDVCVFVGAAVTLSKSLLMIKDSRSPFHRPNKPCFFWVVRFRTNKRLWL